MEKWASQGSGTRTVLFTDMVGSTARRSRLGDTAADVVEREHEELLQGVVARHDGLVVKGTGDGIMAVFDSATQAAACAVAIQQALERRARRGGESLEVRIGLSAGDVGWERGDYFGIPVNEAARLEAAAEGGQILASDLVRLLAGSRSDVRFRFVGSLDLKGLADPVTACEIEWEALGPDATPLPHSLRTAARTPFVGRGAELARLGQVWKEAVSGERRIAFVAGEPGIGKTRLGAEVARAAQDDDAIVLYAACDREVAAPYRPFVEVLGRLVATLGSAQLRFWAGRHAGELTRLLPDLAGSGTATTADPETERLLLFEAVDVILSRASRESGLLLVLDDLHWADGSTLALLRHLARSSEAASLLLLGTYRDTEVASSHPLADVLADLRRDVPVERVSVHGLSAEETSELIVRTGPPPDDALAHRLHVETEGNPFFIGQMLRHLVETGALVKEHGRWTASATFGDAGIPDGIREVVGRRLSRLSDRANRVLAVAAIIGREFDSRVIEGVPEEGTPDEILDALDEAVAARLIDERQSTPGRYTFVHALVQQTLLAELRSGRRARLHRRVGEALDALPDAEPGVLAHQFCAGAAAGTAERAVHWSLAAVQAAMDDLAWEQAQAIAERALEVLERYGRASPTTAGWAARLRIRLGLALVYQGAMEASREQYLLAADEARAAGDVELFAEAAVRRIGWAPVGKPDPRGAALVEEALGLLPPDDLALRAILRGSLAYYWRLFEGRGADAEALASDAVVAARRSGDARVIRATLQYMSVMLVAGPDAAALRSICDELLSEGTTLGEMPIAPEPSTASYSARRAQDLLFSTMSPVAQREFALRHRLVVTLQLGDRDAAEQTLAEFSRAEPNARSRGFVPMWKAMLALMDGDLAAADAANARILELAGTEPNFVSSWAVQLAYLRWEQGRLNEIVPLLERVAEDNPGLVAVQTLLALLRAEGGALDAARALFDRVVAERIAAVPRDFLLAGAVSNLATVCARLGDRDAAAVLHEQLLPFEGQLLQVAWGIACPGAADRYLAMLDSLLGRDADAEQRFAGAVELEEGARAPALAARTRLWWARSLLDGGDEPVSRQAEELLRSCIRFARQRGLVAISDEAQALLATRS